MVSPFVLQALQKKRSEIIILHLLMHPTLISSAIRKQKYILSGACFASWCEVQADASSSDWFGTVHLCSVCSRVDCGQREATVGLVQVVTMGIVAADHIRTRSCEVRPYSA